MIGKSARPRAIRHIPKTSLPVYYTGQKSSWINSYIFTDWFKSEFVPKVKNFLKKEKLPLKATLLIDNAGCHPNADELSVNNIIVKFLPPNTTSIIQPMDQGIIENLKRRYKTSFLSSLLLAQKNNVCITEYLKTVNIKSVIDWLDHAWNCVSDKTIFKCWKNLLPPRFFQLEIQDTNDDTLCNERILEQVQRVNNFADTEIRSIENWVNDPEDTDIPSNAELLSMVRDIQPDSEEDINMPTKITSNDAVIAAEILLSYCQQQNNISMETSSILLEIKNYATKAALLEEI